ncbi:hypothetical protein T492DRAFT_962388 [Pavlovales sp. CCMP2436]|nr:hypothetical protein T492DRAFT_962388 [Pavlovales sp. CCMP2436]
MLIKQSSFLASNLTSGFTLAKAQQGVATALQLQHAQQHNDENSTHFSKRAHFSSPHFDRAEDAPTYFSKGIPMLECNPTLNSASTSVTTVDAFWTQTSPPLSAPALSGLVPAHLMQAHTQTLHPLPSLRPAGSISSGVKGLAGTQLPAVDNPAFKSTLKLVAVVSTAPAPPPLFGHNNTSVLTSCSQHLGEEAAPPPAHIAPQPTAKGTLDEQLLLQFANEIDIDNVEGMFDRASISS